MRPIVDAIVFEPVPMERVWGGRMMESALHKKLPPNVPIGESWELVDRDDVQSMVADGPLKGKSLHQLWDTHRQQLFGSRASASESTRFPLLIKILDASDRLSVQVHPPAALAAKLGGEPKTEMWYLLDAQPGASVYAGLKSGVNRDQFEAALASGTVEPLLHRIPVSAGDSIFIPSGRLHAIAEGCLIVEVQQNSDTTYRVFDWNRLGLDGKPRDLHLRESMESIDFDDFEPSLTGDRGELVAECEYFRVEKWDLTAPRVAAEAGGFAFFTVLSGQVAFGDRTFQVGSMFLIPAVLSDRTVDPVGGDARVLVTSLPV